MHRATALRALRATLQDELDAVLRVAEMAVDEATHAESRAENKYDTRGLEASYLAAGQARRVTELRQGLAWFDGLPETTEMSRAQAGAFVQVEDESERWWCFLTAAAGGSAVEVQGERVRLISARSPIGHALLGATSDDEVSWPTPSGRRSGLVVDVR